MLDVAVRLGIADVVEELGGSVNLGELDVNETKLGMSECKYLRLALESSRAGN